MAFDSLTHVNCDLIRAWCKLCSGTVMSLCTSCCQHFRMTLTLVIGSWLVLLSSTSHRRSVHAALDQLPSLPFSVWFESVPEASGWLRCQEGVLYLQVMNMKNINKRRNTTENNKVYSKYAESLLLFLHGAILCALLSNLMALLADQRNYAKKKEFRYVRLFCSPHSFLATNLQMKRSTICAVSGAGPTSHPQEESCLFAEKTSSTFGKKQDSGYHSKVPRIVMYQFWDVWCVCLNFNFALSVLQPVDHQNCAMARQGDEHNHGTGQHPCNNDQQTHQLCQ